MVTYQAERWLDTCLEAVRALGPLTDLAVVDNASTDGTRARLSGEFAPLIDHLHLPESNLGFGKAHNLVFSQAYAEQYDYFFLLNQDAAISREDFLQLVETADRHPAYGILSPLHDAGDGALERRFSSYLPGGAVPPGQSVVSLPFVNAALWLLRAGVVERIGYFNPVFPHYGEDINYADRARQAGFQIGIVPGARGFHYRTHAAVTGRLDHPPYDHWILGLLRIVDPSKSVAVALRQTLGDYAGLCLGLLVRGKFSLVAQHLRYLARLLRHLPEYRTYAELRVDRPTLGDKAVAP